MAANDFWRYSQALLSPILHAAHGTGSGLHPSLSPRPCAGTGDLLFLDVYYSATMLGGSVRCVLLAVKGAHHQKGSTSCPHRSLSLRLHSHLNQVFDDCARVHSCVLRAPSLDAAIAIFGQSTKRDSLVFISPLYVPRSDDCSRSGTRCLPSVVQRLVLRRVRINMCIPPAFVVLNHGSSNLLLLHPLVSPRAAMRRFYLP